MKENIDLFSSNLINNNDKSFDIMIDSSIKKLQQNLLLMGFDIEMINKIISYYNITNENEALDYLIKNEEGMWNHPFIPKEKVILDNNTGLLNQPKLVMNNVFTRLKSSSINEQINNNTNIKVENDICDVCGESIDFHTIKKYEIKNSINLNLNNGNNENQNNNILIKFNKGEKNQYILIDEDEDIKEEKKEEKKDEAEEDINPDECQICMGPFENAVEIENCKHKFCAGCFTDYLNNLINTNNIDKIPCPKNKCNNDNLSEDFFSQYISEEQYFKYRQFKSKNEIARDAKKIFCPICDSYAQLGPDTPVPDPNSPDYVKSVLKCQNSHEFCSCGRKFHEGQCFKDEQEFKDLIISEQIKKCPKCGFLIKKNNGCNHMTCGNPLCKYEFCWLCMNEAVPNHFDFGPCAGKQFYDPDSFINRFMEDHPNISPILRVIMTIIAIINLIVSFIVLPFIGFSVFAYITLYEEEDVIIRNTKIRFFTLMIIICVSLYCQSFAYMFWILGFSLIILFLIAFPILFLISSLCKLLFLRNARYEIYQEDSHIEMSQNINNNMENNVDENN